MAQAPDVFQVKFTTTTGDFVIEAHRAWAPHGVDRFHELVTQNYYDEVRFFRVLSGFMAQFGIHGDPKMAAKWRDAKIPDDPVTQNNTRGMVTYATAGPNTRTTQLFINFGDNRALDRQGFAPFGKVISGMDVVDKLHAAYGEGAPSGRGPDQGRIQREGNAYLSKDFAQLDHIKSARIVQPKA
jgi:peptidyl-prolyl cis-trans isomerase A (cyclophilin A)